MAATFWLIRHAAHGHLNRTLTGRMDEVPLTDEGRFQAEELAGRLQSDPPSHVVTSPRERARATAQAIATAARLPTPEPDDVFDEIDFGAWTGRDFAVLDGDPAWVRWNTARSAACPPGGEPAAQAKARVMAGLARLAVKHEGGVVAVVTHADIIRSAVCAVLDLSLDHLLRFDVDPASVTRVQIGPDRLLSLNERTA